VPSVDLTLRLFRAPVSWEECILLPDELPVAFEAIQALPGFCQLLKRSPTLDGSLPLRAAQHCSPVFEGNEAGFQISLEQPMNLRRGRAGLQIDMTPPAFKQTQEDVGACIDELVKRGLLQKNGHWHRLLRTDALPIRGTRLHFWSGFLVKPAEGVALRVGRAFNRRSRITVVEHAIVDRSGFTPLMLEIDGRDLGPEPRTIIGEIGSVLPVAAHARMTLTSVRKAPEVVRSVEAFFDAHYFETKKTKPTGKYRRMLREHPDLPAAATCEVKVAYAGPAVHTVDALERFHGPGGITKRAPENVALPYCTVRNIARLEAEWDGQGFTNENKVFDRTNSLDRDWKAVGGRRSSDAYEFFSGYFYEPARDEPYWLLQPWIFSTTPPGWSTVIEGASVGGCDGMRGIIRTDHFSTVSMVYRMYNAGRIAVPKGIPIMRFFPIPRRLQDAVMRLVDVKSTQVI
jgi:hypothetical protein